MATWPITSASTLSPKAARPAAPSAAVLGKDFADVPVQPEVPYLVGFDEVPHEPLPHRVGSPLLFLVSPWVLADSVLDCLLPQCVPTGGVDVHLKQDVDDDFYLLSVGQRQPLASGLT